MTFNGVFAGGSINGGSGNDSPSSIQLSLAAPPFLEELARIPSVDLVSPLVHLMFPSGVEQVMTPSTSPPLLAVLELLTSGTAHPELTQLSSVMLSPLVVQDRLELCSV